MYVLLVMKSNSEINDRNLNTALSGIYLLIISQTKSVDIQFASVCASSHVTYQAHHIKSIHMQTLLRLVFERTFMVQISPLVLEVQHHPGALPMEKLRKKILKATVYHSVEE